MKKKVSKTKMFYIIVLIIILFFFTCYFYFTKNYKTIKPYITINISRGEKYNENEYKIISKQWDGNDKLIINIETSVNCCSSKKGFYNSDEEKISLFLEESGNFCWSKCNFRSNYILNALQKKDYEIEFSKSVKY
ncbi:MAG: hypothetical protein P1P85_01505 [Patescibacteria group bacterium]|nr:hypothetical protein [Patescibacteria group bacterium]